MLIEWEFPQHLVNKSYFNFVKMQLLNHFSDHIRQLGNLSYASSKLPGRAMMDLNKCTDKWIIMMLHSRFCEWKPERRCFSIQLNAHTAIQHSNDEMPLTKAPIKRMMNNLQPEIKTLDDLAEWCAMPEEELPNHIARSCRRFADCKDYFDHNQCFSHLNHAKYIKYITRAIPVTSFQCDQQAVYMVRISRSTRWRKHKPPTTGTVLLWMGRSLDSRLRSTAGSIPAELKCHLVVEHAELSIDGLLGLVQMFATALICQTAGIVIVEERYQPPIQPLNDGSYRHNPLFGVGTTYIVPVPMIQGALHLLLQTPQPDSM